jgi:hypothetical protein
MSTNTKDRARVSVEVLEGRQLPSAHITSALQTLAPATVTTQPGGNLTVNYGNALRTTTPHAATALYAVVGLRNRTGAGLTFQFRWTSQSGWATYTLPPGSSLYFWSTATTGTAQFRFSGRAGSYTPPYTVNVHKVLRTTTPTWTDAAHYAVTRTGGTFRVSPSAS